MININQLNKSFGLKTILDNITLNIEEGKCTALIGKKWRRQVNINRYTNWS